MGGFNDGSIVIWDSQNKENPVVQTLQAKQNNVKYTGISSVAISDDGETIAAHDFSGVASIFQKTYVDDESDSASLSSSLQSPSSSLK